MRVNKSTIKGVKSNFVSDNDSGDQSRSAFELSNDGKNKLVLDEIQYQLDFLMSKSTLSARRRAALQLINICASPEKNVHQILRLSGIEETILQLCSVLEKVDDNDVLESILSLILLLLQGKDGSINGSVRLTKSAFLTILHCKVAKNEKEQHHVSEPAASQSADSSPLKIGDGELKPSTTSVIHRKRKFAGATATAVTALKSQAASGLVSSNTSVVEGQQSDLSSADVTPIKKSRPNSVLSGSPSGVRTPLFSSNNNQGGSAHASPGLVRISSTQGTPVSSSSSCASAMPLDVFAEKFRSNLFSPQMGSNLAQCGSIREVVRILWPVLFSLFAVSVAGTPDALRQQQQEIETLRLVLVNRILTAKVNKLTTVSTSGYSSCSSSGSGSGGSDSRNSGGDVEEDESALLLQELNECQSALRENYTLRGASSSGSSKTVSRSNSTSHVSSILSQQRAEENTGEGGVFKSQAYLKQLARSLQSDLDTLMAALKGGADPDDATNADLPLAAAARVHLVLGILGAACSRDPVSQQYITKIKMQSPIFHDPGQFPGFNGDVSSACQWTEDTQDSFTTNQPADSWAAAGNYSGGMTVPLVLVHLLHSLTPEVTRSLQRTSSINDDHKNEACVVSIDGISWNFKDLTRFYKLFPEFAVHDSGALASSPLTSSDLTPLGSVVDLSAPRLFTSCLECLISVTNYNESSCLALLAHRLPLLLLSETGGQSTRRSRQGQQQQQQQSVVDFLVSVLVYCACWRCIVVQQQREAAEANVRNGGDSKTGDEAKSVNGPAETCVVDQGQATETAMGSGALSPSETMLERCTFDLTLYLLSLLTNIAEFSYRFHKQEAAQTRHHSPSFMNVDVLTIVKSNSFLHRQFKTLASSTAATSEDNSLLTFFLAGLHSQPHPHPPRASDLYQFLIDLITSETRDFLQDFVDTDEAVQNSGSSASEGRPLLKESGESASDSSVAPAAAGVNRNEEVPIAELILSSHAVLLLHTLTVVTAMEGENESSQSSAAAVVPAKGKSLSRSSSTSAGAVTATAPGSSQGGGEVSFEFVLYDVRPRLPRSSWWLCVRILKAFMTLQLQTGIMLLENVTPVLKAIQSMTAQDAQQSCSSGRDKPLNLLMDSVQPLVIEGVSACQPAFDDFDALFLTGTGADDKAKIKSRDAVSDKPSGENNSEGGNQASGEWKWNGSDFVWITFDTTMAMPAAAVVVVEPEEVSVPQSNSSSSSSSSSKKKAIKAGVQSCSQPVTSMIVDLIDDPPPITTTITSTGSQNKSSVSSSGKTSSQLQTKASDGAAAGTSIAIQTKSSYSQSSQSKSSQPSSDSDTKKEQAAKEETVEEEEEEGVGSAASEGDVEVLEVDQADFTHVEWFNRPSTWKTYGTAGHHDSVSSSSGAGGASGAGRRAASEKQTKSGDYEGKEEDELSSPHRDVFRSKRKRAGGTAGGLVAGSAMNSVIETERLIDAIMAGSSFNSKQTGKDHSHASSGSTQSSFRSSSASTLSESSIRDKKKNNNSNAGAQRGNDW